MEKQTLLKSGAILDTRQMLLATDLDGVVEAIDAWDPKVFHYVGDCRSVAPGWPGCGHDSSGLSWPIGDARAAASPAVCAIAGTAMDPSKQLCCTVLQAAHGLVLGRLLHKSFMPAVVCWQAGVRAAAMERFVGGFYKSLGGGAEVEVAFAEACNSVLAAGFKLGPPEAGEKNGGVPCLLVEVETPALQHARTALPDAIIEVMPPLKLDFSAFAGAIAGSKRGPEFDHQATSAGWHVGMVSGVVSGFPPPSTFALDPRADKSWITLAGLTSARHRAGSCLEGAGSRRWWTVAGEGASTSSEVLDLRISRSHWAAGPCLIKPRAGASVSFFAAERQLLVSGGDRIFGPCVTGYRLSVEAIDVDTEDARVLTHLRMASPRSCHGTLVLEG